MKRSQYSQSQNASLNIAEESSYTPENSDTNQNQRAERPSQNSNQMDVRTSSMDDGAGDNSTVLAPARDPASTASGGRGPFGSSQQPAEKAVVYNPEPRTTNVKKTVTNTSTNSNTVTPRLSNNVAKSQTSGANTVSVRGSTNRAKPSPRGVPPQSKAPL